MLSISERIHQVASGSKAWHLGMLSSEVAGLEQRLLDTEKREAVLRECVELYADPTNWSDNTYYLFKACLRGKEPAQAALAKVEGMEGEEFSPNDVMPRINGKCFRCECGCNVFRESIAGNRYKCNACNAIFVGE